MKELNLLPEDLHRSRFKVGANSFIGGNTNRLTYIIKYYRNDDKIISVGGLRQISPKPVAKTKIESMFDIPFDIVEPQTFRFPHNGRI